MQRHVDGNYSYRSCFDYVRQGTDVERKQKKKVGNWCRLSVLCVFVAFNPLQLKTIQLKYIVLQSVERPATNNPSIVLSIASIGLSSGL